MQKLISPKSIALTFGVLVICFLAVFYVIAWTEPTEAPPEGNVEAPINVSDTAQTKQGNLTINGVLKTLQDMIVDIVTIQGDGSMSPNLNADKLDDYQAADFLLAASGGGGAVTLIGDTGSAPACPAGWTEAQYGYWNCFAAGHCFCGSQKIYNGQKASNYWIAYACGNATCGLAYRCRVCVK
ncbi:MAG: hypothetical protein ABIB55_01620 [Candidatus Nealsonbacteria bacterium]